MRSSPSRRREPEIARACPSCGREAGAGLDGRGACRSCSASVVVDVPETLRASRILEACPACGNGLLYVQRDFNQKVGLGVVIVAAALAPFTPFSASLFVAAAIDAG